MSSVSATDSAKAQLYDCRDAYSQAIEAIAASDPRVCAVVSDSVSSTKLKSFSQKFPQRFVNVGIAEQNMVGVGADVRHFHFPSGHLDRGRGASVLAGRPYPCLIKIVNGPIPLPPRYFVG